jgi:hypothetical protein
MATHPTITIEGKAYVLLLREEYERLVTLAKAAELHPLPEPDAKGNYPTVEYAAAGLARKIIRDRAEAGLTQRKLAEPEAIPPPLAASLSRHPLVPLATASRVPMPQSQQQFFGYLPIQPLPTSQSHRVSKVLRQQVLSKKAENGLPEREFRPMKRAAF